MIEINSNSRSENMDYEEGILLMSLAEKVFELLSDREK